METGKVVVREKSAEPAEDTVATAETGAERASESSDGPPASAEAKDGRAAPPGIESLKPGMKIKGKVRKVVNFGAFVDVGVGRDGLVHISALKTAGIDKEIKAGQDLDVVVRRVSKQGSRISLTVPNAGGGSKTRLQELRVDSVVEGRVVRLVDFGAFVDIGARADGLLHVSQLPRGYVDNPSEILEVGEEIQVRILGVDPRKRRISLSMRELEDDAPSRPAPEPVENRSHIPTAFEVAFQEALADRRRREGRG